ncbi:helix-turn-helix domain-containing protein [Bradyrhizobium sp. 200]|nr:helix-turn-helix domain-containing protein [Bradyrhizobium sp. 200]
MLERLHTLQDISDSLRISLSTLRRALRSGELSHTRIGKRGQVRVSRIDLDTWLAKRQTNREPAQTSIAPDQSTAAGKEGRKSAELRTRSGHVGTKLSYRILTADVREGLKSLERKSVNTIITSPPYYWQRDYDVDGQIGHEDTIEGYVTALAETFSEAKDVLADDGLLFLNLGDSYYNAKGKPHGRDSKNGARQIARQRLRAVDGPGLGLPRKSLIGLPWRVALALQARGWTLRSNVIWHRPNALGEPTSKDRPWRTHENVFIFSKQPKYFFDRSSLGKEEDIWTIRARPENPYAHCAPFPVELVERCIQCGCKPNGIVLDPFVGSGTTLVAALASGRSAIGIELNDRYSALAERRVRDAVLNKNKSTPRK